MGSWWDDEEDKKDEEDEEESSSRDSMGGIMGIGAIFAILLGLLFMISNKQEHDAARQLKAENHNLKGVTLAQMFESKVKNMGFDERAKLARRFGYQGSFNRNHPIYFGHYTVLGGYCMEHYGKRFPISEEKIKEYVKEKTVKKKRQ